MISEYWITFVAGGIIPMLVYLVPLTIISFRMGRRKAWLLLPWVLTAAIIPIHHAASPPVAIVFIGWSRSLAQATRLAVIATLGVLAVIGMQRRDPTVAKAFA